ncbi:hypothetical protein ACFO0U_12880 [Chromohalobacter sarecensis]|uniref:Uncharacterized protein n=1 Tax=Chromohalobacter sarecensis TaxID=245294 RepID=A0ABV9D410_9GAMM|nr:hypothetical protein [Chromohalobacter sarecensis]MCK0715924.1 hypothetical protein [Chromohalobacter sarecensis]
MSKPPFRLVVSHLTLDWSDFHHLFVIMTPNAYARFRTPPFVEWTARYRLVFNTIMVQCNIAAQLPHAASYDVDLKTGGGIDDPEVT